MTAFHPQMLILAREAAGLSQASLASGIGVSQAYLSQIEHGFKTPTPDLIIRMSEATDRSADLFGINAEPLGDGIVEFFHKKRLTLPAKPLRRAHALVNLFRISLDRLLRVMEINFGNSLPSFSLDTVDSPEEAARMIRRHLRLANGPIRDLTAYIESMGIVVLVADLGHRKLSAISVPLENAEFLIVLNSMLSNSDRRFALAHELGHFVMHRDMAQLSDLEKEADSFAGALLLPYEGVKDDLQRMKLSMLGSLKAKWGVPMKALVYRATELGVISDDESLRLYKYLSASLSGTFTEPGDVAPEGPNLVKAAVKYFEDDLGYTVDQVANVMAVTVDQLRSSFLGEPRRPRLKRISSENTFTFPAP